MAKVPMKACNNHVLDIELHSSPYQLYTPGSRLSGQVVFKGDGETAKIEIEFVGMNYTQIVTHEDNSTRLVPIHLWDEAVLFHYHQVLKNGELPSISKGRAQIAGQRSTHHWPFCFRFPSTTESRRTVIYKNANQELWTHQKHSLPPSFDTSPDLDGLGIDSVGLGSPTSNVTSECKIEYSLIAKVSDPWHPPVVFKIPVQFVPTESHPGLVVRQHGRSPWHLAPDPVMENHTMEIGYHDRYIVRPIIDMSIQPPSSIRIGQPFRISGRLIPHPVITIPSVILAGIVSMEVSKLELVCRTIWRAAQGQSPTTADRRHSFQGIERQHEQLLVISLTHTIPMMHADPSMEGVGFVFESGRRSHLAPSFGSFLIANRYELHGTMSVVTCGIHQSFAFHISNVPVLSPLRASPLNTRNIIVANQRRFSSAI